MADTQIDALTSEAFAAKESGDTEAMQQAFAQRDAVAKGAPSGEGLLSADDAAALLSTTDGGAEFVGAGLGDDLQLAQTYAPQIEADPKYAGMAKALEPYAGDPHIQAQVISFLIREARSRDFQKTQKETKKMQDRDSKPRAGRDDELTELYRLIGTAPEEYRSAPVQKRIRELERAKGDEPIVGGRGPDHLRTL
jgi:hypothetical protein